MTATPGSPDSVLAFTSGDVAAARLLRANLTRLAEQVDDERLRRDIRSTLAGSMSVHELADTPLLRDLVQQGVREFTEAWDQLTPDQRQREVQVGRQQDEKPHAD